MTAGGDETGDLFDIPSRRMERCPACGRRRIEGGVCEACGHRAIDVTVRDTIGSPPASALNADVFYPLTGRVDGHFGLLREVPSMTPDVSPSSLSGGNPESSAGFPSPPAYGTGPHLVSGRVLYLSPITYEPMDLDPWRWVAIPVWGLVLLATPVAGTLTAWEVGGPLVALAVAIILLMVLRYVFSNRLFDSWHLVAALNGRHVVESIPVQVVRIRQWDGRETQLRFKGLFANGAVMEGDRIQATGRWRGGVFAVAESTCERTGARITPRQPRARNVALTGLVILAGMLLWILIAGFSVHSSFRAAGFPSSLPFEIPAPTTPLFQ
jgi:hypothetical protein